MGRKAIILGAVAVLAWVTAASGGGVDEAFQRRLEGKADEAMKILEAECAADGAPAAAYFEMSRLQCYLMDFTACLAAIDRAVEMEPGNARYHYFSGIFSLYALIDAAHHHDEARMKELGRRALAELEAALTYSFALAADSPCVEAGVVVIGQIPSGLFIVCAKGDDVIDGMGGNDRICGGAGAGKRHENAQSTPPSARLMNGDGRDAWARG